MIMVDKVTYVGQGKQKLQISILIEQLLQIHRLS